MARRRPAGPATRTEILNRLATLMAGPWAAFIGVAQANEAAMRNRTTAEEFTERIDASPTYSNPATRSPAE
jgi:hypothetical protein